MRTPTDAGTSLQVLRIVMEEIPYLPVVESVSDVLRLREDKRIRPFRETLHRWARRMEQGDAKEEARLRQELRKSCTSLKKLKRYQTVNRFVTYLAVPAIAVPELRIPATALSLLGAAIELRADIIKWRTRWLRIGHT